MTPGQALELGYRTAAAGFFFDGLELIAGCAPLCGGIDNLRGGFELLLPERDGVNADMDWLAEVCSGAFGRTWSPPRGVDDYRLMLTHGVFEIVNRWSYIADVKQVTRLQAWFYAGFGLGRARTVLLGVRLLDRLRERVTGPSPLDDTPGNLHRLAVEAAKQMQVAGEEDDLSRVRPLLEDAARRAQGLSLLVQRQRHELLWTEACNDDLRALDDTARALRLDLGRGRA